MLLDQKGAVTEVNSHKVSNWLLEKQKAAALNVSYDFSKRENLKSRIDRSIDDIIKKKSNDRLIPEAPKWITAILGYSRE